METNKMHDVAYLQSALVASNLKLDAAQNDLGKWKLTFEFENDGERLVLICRKGDGNGARKIIPIQDIEFYADDSSTYAGILADEFYDHLVKKVVVAALMDAGLDSTLKNANKFLAR